jgi:hypothetical protein
VAGTGRQQRLAGLQNIPFRTSRELFINNYYYLDEVCHFGIVNFGYLDIHHKGTKDTKGL